MAASLLTSFDDRIDLVLVKATTQCVQMGTCLPTLWVTDFGLRSTWRWRRAESGVFRGRASRRRRSDRVRLGQVVPAAAMRLARRWRQAVWRVVLDHELRRRHQS